jgi:hypothetical protein
MLRPTAVSVQAICKYQILVQFDNGEKKCFDVEPYIKGDWYGKLKDYEYFKRVSTDGFTVVWSDGQDICPDELYDMGNAVS